jgi:hypothetical protein
MAWREWIGLERRDWLTTKRLSQLAMQLIAIQQYSNTATKDGGSSDLVITRMGIKEGWQQKIADRNSHKRSQTAIPGQ